MFKSLLFLLFFTWTALVCAQDPFGARLDLIVTPGKKLAGQPFNVSWTKKRLGGRDGPNDFHIFALQSTARAFDGTQVLSVLEGQTTGQITIAQPGTYRLIAINDDREQEEDIFTRGFAATDQFTVEGDGSTPSIDLLPAQPTSSNKPGKSDSDQSDEQCKQPAAGLTHAALIVATLFGTLIVVAICLLLFYAFAYRPRKRRQQALIDRLQNSSPGMMRSNSFPTSGARTPIWHHPASLMTGTQTSTWRSDYSMSRNNRDLEPPSYPFISQGAVGGSQDPEKKRPLSFPSINDPTDTLRFRPLTDRQMDVQDKIQMMSAKLLGLREDSVEFDEIVRKVEVLEQILKSDWALDKTDDVPPGLL